MTLPENLWPARIRDRFFGRGLGWPIRTGTHFIRTGPASHQKRMIMLDTIVRSYVSNPTIEYFADQSLRYSALPGQQRLTDAVADNRDLRAYCAAGTAHAWAYLFSPVCSHCWRPYTEHVRGKCLFEPTNWNEHLMADVRVLYDCAGG